MIYLESDEYRAKELLLGLDNSSFLGVTISHCFSVYGLGYNFQELFIQCVDAKPAAFILRYNSTVYCYVSDSVDMEELQPFISGFTGCEIITNISDNDARMFGLEAEELFEMKRTGKGNCELCDDVTEVSTDITKALSVLKEHLHPMKYEDFLLNMSFQQRHGLLKVYSSLFDGVYTCVLGVTELYDNIKTISFLYTKRDFRGNSFAQKVLDSACKEDADYFLICEKHNLEFYRKCDFIQISVMSKIQL